MRHLGVTLAAAIAVLAGCTSIQNAPPTAANSEQGGASDCRSWLRSVDRTVAEAGVADASGYRVPGFPYLRVNRFLASFRDEASASAGVFDDWARAARRLDREAREVELRNLPSEKLESLGAAPLAVAAARTEACAAELMRSELSAPQARASALSGSAVPDDYESWNRVLGLYPVLRIPFSAGVEHWHDDAIAAFTSYASGERSDATTLRYAPAAHEPMTPQEVAQLLSSRSTGALSQLELSRAELDRLFGTFAPVLEVETGSDDDQVGFVRLNAEGRAVVITAAAVIYRRLAYTRMNGEVLPQLVYTAWFPARPRSSALDVLAGRLDGLVFRVTLGRDGLPLVYDSIHPCGCYHMFFPTAKLRPRPAPDPRDEWAFVPATLPQAQPRERVVLHVQAGTHYLTGVTIADTAGTRHYTLDDEDSLRSLPVPGGGRRSIYSPDGLVAGSERLERFLFWPMGVPSAGTMRQWGHHATAFLGIRHFDDAFLMQDRFGPAR